MKAREGAKDGDARGPWRAASPNKPPSAEAGGAVRGMGWSGGEAVVKNVAG